MIDYFLVLAVVLMIAGVLGSIIPALPGPVFSIIGALIYWWSTDYTTPGPIILTIIILTGLLAIILDLVASYYGADKSGASHKTALAAAISSSLLFLVTGPLGILIGTAGTVLIRELMLGKEFDEALKTATTTTLALLGSAAAKVGLTLLMLALFTVSLFL